MDDGKVTVSERRTGVRSTGVEVPTVFRTANRGCMRSM
jgi:hypothetical protein|eukprot:COSAG06_NODE_1641_length_8829_cov_23.966667_7_plen_38_part_00